VGRVGWTGNLLTTRRRQGQYLPDRGDAVWLTFDPQAGHEQSGRRPAVVLSPRSYNYKAGLAHICPVTSQVKGYPFEVILPAGLPLKGVVLADQVRSLDWRARRASRICELPDATTDEILGKLETLLTRA
jgi:mRNA interferase MazF